MLRSLGILLLLTIAPLLKSERLSSLHSADTARIIERAYNMDRAVASEIEQLSERNPKDPLYPFLLASIYLWEITYTLSEAKLDDSFNTALSHAEERARQARKADRNNIDALFLLGMIEILKSRFHLDNKNWWRAFTNLRSGMKTLDRVLKQDPQYHDAKLPKAAALCYMEDVPSYLAPLAFILRYKADLQGGLTTLEEVKAKGNLMKYEASMYLGSVYNEVMKDQKKAKEEYLWMEKRFPKNITIRRMVANRDYLLKEDQAAFDRYRSILSSAKDDERFTRLGVIIHCRIGYLFFRNQQYDDSLEAYHAALIVCESLGRYGSLESQSQYWIGMNEARKKNVETAKLYLRKVDKNKSKRYFEKAAGALSQIRDIEAKQSPKNPNLPKAKN